MADPIYVPVDVEFHGATVSHAGMRYKGNSSLSFLYGDGIRKNSRFASTSTSSAITGPARLASVSWASKS